MRFLNRINDWGKRNMFWIMIASLLGCVALIYARPHQEFIFAADGKTYNCTEYDIDRQPLVNFSVDDKGTTSVVMTPTYVVHLYKREPHHFLRTTVAEFSCKSYNVYTLKDHDPSKP